MVVICGYGLFSDLGMVKVSCYGLSLATSSDYGMVKVSGYDLPLATTSE